MIESIKCIKNLGPFKSVHDVKLAQTTLIFAENGRGKTMLSEAFRSLATGQTELVADRKRLGEDGEQPQAMLTRSGGATLSWTPSRWKGGKPKMAVFNDGFVDANVYSGLEVTSEHRKGLHSLVIGEKGVRLAEDFKTAQACATKALDEANKVAGEIKATVPGLKDEDVGKYCEKLVPDDIEELIKDNARSLANARNATKIAARAPLPKLELPNLLLNELSDLLSKGIPHVAADAMDRVRTHLNGLWEGAESWVNQGWSNARDHAACPFCGQPLKNSSIAEHFATYFEGAYGDLKSEIAEFRADFETHNSEGQRRRFEEQARQLAESRTEWASDIVGLRAELPFDSSQITEDWQSFADEARRALARKDASPLEPVRIDTSVLNRLSGHLRSITTENELQPDVNEKIRSFKERVGSMDIQALENEKSELERLKERNTPRIKELCEKYIERAKVREREKAKRDRLNDQLRAYRERVFEEYSESVDRYLRDFGTGFSLSGIRGTSRAGGTSEFGLEINRQQVEITGERPTTGGAWFNNTLSGGDRTALAFAFFLASLERREDLNDTIVVIDDPLSSLDYARRQATATMIQRLAPEVMQLMVLSHDLSFLCIAERLLKKQPRRHLQIRTNDGSSAVSCWDVSEACLAEYESRALRLRRFCSGEVYNPAEIKVDIRIHIETYLLISFPDQYDRLRPMRTFLSRCRDAIKAGEAILSKDRTKRLAEIVSFVDPEMHPHPYHSASDSELLSWAQRALEFCGDPGR